jgi:hypothetical protein
MPNLEEKMSVIAEQVLKRPLSEEEKDDVFRIADAVGMKDVQSFLHLIRVFKLHEQRMRGNSLSRWRDRRLRAVWRTLDRRESGGR